MPQGYAIVFIILGPLIIGIAMLKRDILLRNYRFRSMAEIVGETGARVLQIIAGVIVLITGILGLLNII